VGGCVDVVVVVVVGNQGGLNDMAKKRIISRLSIKICCDIWCLLASVN